MIVLFDTDVILDLLLRAVGVKQRNRLRIGKEVMEL